MISSKSVSKSKYHSMAFMASVFMMGGKFGSQVPSDDPRKNKCKYCGLTCLEVFCDSICEKMQGMRDAAHKDKQK